jgi:hypothetical protein
MKMEYNMGHEHINRAPRRRVVLLNLLFLAVAFLIFLASMSGFFWAVGAFTFYDTGIYSDIPSWPPGARLWFIAVHAIFVVVAGVLTARLIEWVRT